MKSENNFGFVIGSVMCAFKVVESCKAASARSRSIFVALSESRENGCVDGVGKASCELNSCTSDKTLRVCAALRELD